MNYPKIVLATTLAISTAAVALPSFAREQISIVGSSTVYPFATQVAERFGSRESYPTPVVESTGTGGGMKLFCGGIGEKFPDISNASRAIKASEKENCASNGVKDIIEIAFGNDGIAFANSVKGPKLNFTVQQLWQALAEKGKKPQKWNDIDASLPNVKISVLIPPPTSGTRDAWNSLVMGKGCPAEVKKADKKSCKIMREDGAAIEAGENDSLIVKKLNANPNIFGIFGFSYLDNNDDHIQAATINGIEISLENIQSYKYPVSRPLYFYVKKAHIGVIPGLDTYLNYFTDKKAIGKEGYLADVGLVPLDANKMAEVANIAKNQIPMK